MLAVALLLIFTQPGNEDEDEESQTTVDTTIALFDGRSEDVASINVKNESGEFTISQDAKGFHIDELDGLDQNETTLKGDSQHCHLDEGADACRGGRRGSFKVRS